MKKILVINPAIASANLGDFIIEEVVWQYLQQWFPDSLLIEIPSHTPINNFYFYSLKKHDFTIVTGTNLLQNFPSITDRQWDIKTSDLSRLNNVVLFGTGWRHYRYKPHFLTPFFYRRLLSKNILHSVRDEFTKKTLEGLGIKNVLNTSCPTTWLLTPDFIADIPTRKGTKVVTTLTNYAKDPENDQKMIQLLLDNYETVYLWCQGMGDYKYYLNSCFDERVIVLSTTLLSFKDVLQLDDIDYVGTRLHGGIYALRHKKRTIILAVDNRASEIHKDINLPVIKRGETDLLKEKIVTEWKTEINLLQNEIDTFINQFKK